MLFVLMESGKPVGVTETKSDAMTWVRQGDYEGQRTYEEVKQLKHLDGKLALRGDRQLG